MSGQLGNFSIGGALDNATQNREETRREEGGYDDSRRYNNDGRGYGPRDNGYGSRDYGPRNDDYMRRDYPRRNDGYSHRDGYGSRDYQGRDNRRDYGHHDFPRRNSYRRDDDRESLYSNLNSCLDYRPREPRLTQADQDDNWRRGANASSTPVAESESRRYDEQRSYSHYGRDRNGGSRYSRDGGRFGRDDRDGGRFGRDDRDGGRFGRDGRDGGRFGRDDRPTYRQSEGEDSGEPRSRDLERRPSQDMRQRDSQMGRTGVKP